MRLDFRSVVFSCSLLTALVALLLGVYVLTLRRRSPEILAWAVAYGLLAFGAGLVVLRDNIPIVLSVVVSNVFLCGFIVAVRFGIYFFLGRKPRWGWAIAGLGAILAWTSYFSLVSPSLPARFYAYNSFLGVVALWSAASLASKPGPGLAAVSRIGASLLALLGIAGILRIVLALALGLPGDLMAQASWDSLVQVAQAVAVCALAFSLMLLRTEGLNAELAQAVRDRELLVREMAHRTKNDLSLVDSLISLEEDALSALLAGADESIIRVGEERLDALRERIRCMARAHERLSLSAELGAIRLDEYLGAVADGLPNRPGIVVERDFAVAEVPFALASPLGLVMNELAVNALKYAFPGGRGGRLSLALRAEGEGAERKLRLDVADDGIGTSWPPENPGLGSMIVESFAKKIGGRLDFSRKEGSAFSLSFAPPSLAER
jgi:two-component sensor histidine kinase